MRFRTNCALPSLLSSLITFFLLANVNGATRVPAVFGNHMVLQRDQPLTIWGWDSPGTEITVSVSTAKASVKTDADGAWTLELPALPVGGPHQLTVQGTDTLSINDVLVGEVWICSGQSNMEFPVSRSDQAEKEISAANWPTIRHLKLRHTPAATPQTEVPSDGWSVCSPETVGSYTAVGYFFARSIQQELDVPVGLIGTNWGGTRIEPWTPPEGFRSVPALAEWARKLDEFPAKDNNGKIQHQSPLALYNGMIHPLVPFAVRGALWYQGESNNGEGLLYNEKMKALIDGWRTVWKRPDLPFYYVQLAPYRYKGNPTALPGIWEAQLKTLDVPNTGMAVTVDIGNVADIHPRNKQDVGKRLALWALAKTYGREGLVFSGPLYESMKVEGKRIRLRFRYVGSGLESRDGSPLAGFSIAGEDRKFVDAHAEIDGDTVIVHAESVTQPVAVRFGWHQESQPNLSNRDGLPASPFRTDSW